MKSHWIIKVLGVALLFAAAGGLFILAYWRHGGGNQFYGIP
jgi:hypothetical protein